MYCIVLIIKIASNLSEKSLRPENVMMNGQLAEQAILPTLLACRPPSKSVVIKVLTIFSASPSLTKRAGMQIILALLCCRTRLAISSPQQMAARIRWCLLAVMATPLAEPQSKIPKAASPFSTARQQDGQNQDNQPNLLNECQNLYRIRPLPSRKEIRSSL